MAKAGAPDLTPKRKPATRVPPRIKPVRRQPGPRRWDRVIGLLRDWWAPILAITAAVLVVGRVLAVVNGDARMAAALVSSTSGLSIALSALVSYVPLVVAFVALSACSLLYFAVTRNPKRRPWSVLGAAFVALGGIYYAMSLATSSEVLGGAVFFLALPYGVEHRLLDENGSDGGGKVRVEDVVSEVAPRDLGAAAVIVLVLLAALGSWFAISSRAPWVPAEHVTVRGATQTGYVMAADGVWTTLLTELDRAVLIVRTDDISARSLCRPADQETTALIEINEFRGIPDRLPGC
jgi:hypothetical protein